MTMVQSHIEQSENGTLYVAGTRYKVKILILEHIAWGMNAEEIRDGHPRLTLADVHAVLTYFYDNEAAVRKQLDEDFQKAQELCKRFPRTITRQELLDRCKQQDPGSVQK